MILGLDISSAYIGWCLLSEIEHFIDIGYLDLRKDKTLYKKLDKFSEFLTSLKKPYVAAQLKVFIEAPLPRSNNQNVVNLLQRWNGFCCTEVYRILETEPTLVTNRDALNIAGITIPKGVKGLDRKKNILTYVQSLGIIPEDKWELKKTGNPKDWCFDQADAYVVSIAGAKST